MIAELSQYIWPATVLIIFIGMWMIVMRALSIAHDLSKTVLQQFARVQVPAPLPTAEPASAPPMVKISPAPSAAPVIDQGLIDFVKKEEGFKATPYWDYKQWTVGYGTKASGPGDVVTETEAQQRLLVELQSAAKHVNDFMPNLPKGQQQALIDLTFNAGPGWEQGSLGNQVKAQKIDSIKADILLYNHAGGQVNAGLTARREAEISWFDNPL